MSPIHLCSRPLGDSLVKEEGTICFPSLNPSPAFSTGVHLEADTLSGTYREVLNMLSQLKPVPRALIVLGVKGTGLEAFLQELPPEIALLPIAGGVVARHDLEGSGTMYPECPEVTVCALLEGQWRAKTVSFHRHTEKHLTVDASSPRHIQHIDMDGRSHSPIDWFVQSAASVGIREGIWDRLAFRTAEGRILHASPDTDGIKVGADLPASGLLELVVFDESYGRETLNHLPKGSLVFGCAGLNGLMSLERPWSSHPTAYLYGEVVVLSGKPSFANLSFSLLVPASSG